ncbi:hypothetical protein AIOL_002973 [Candidatus Rhodobacter oscarellae]|uniref:Uncharacterized protein n=1 Tax=Candidatus Rhodobacter oscarellae TaxID=1675527 RepID=A0A0J9E5F9_9RHOB|nr:hypothetical protein [Candidatus Rhodobacter lobularis]KMW58005.1 hypothetical protein AIOL_002973 [Candidatus Rhodobacter lobularis]
MNPGDVLGLYRITIREKSDEPCHVIASFWDPVGNGTVGPKGEFIACHGNANRNNSGDPATVRLAAPQVFVTGVSLCMNGGGDKVKGVAVEARAGACLLGQDPITIPSEARLSPSSADLGRAPRTAGVRDDDSALQERPRRNVPVDGGGTLTGTRLTGD